VRSSVEVTCTLSLLTTKASRTYRIGAYAGSIPTRRRNGRFADAREKKISRASLFVAHSAFLSSPSSICLGSAVSSASLPSLSSSWNSCAFGSGTAGQDDDRVLAFSRMTNKRKRVARADEGKLARVGTWGSRKSQARGWGRVRTFAAAWKLFTVFPRLLPSSGSLLGPKSTAATPPMTTSSGRPRPNRPIVATDLLPAPRAPPAVTMPALSAEGLPRNAGADPVRPDMAHDLGACALGAEALPRASPGRTTVAVVGREAMTILFRRGHGKVCYPRGRTNAATCAAARSTAGPGTGVSYCSRALRCVRSGARSRQRLAERPSPDAPDQPSASISENSLAADFVRNRRAGLIILLRRIIATRARPLVPPLPMDEADVDHRDVLLLRVVP